MARVIDPAIADLQFECDAAPGTRGRRAALILGYAGFWKALAWCICCSIVRVPLQWAFHEDWAMTRTVVLACALGAIVTVGMTLPPLFVGDRTSPIDGFLFATLVPQAMIFGLHVGLAFGVVVALRGRPLTRRLLRSMILLALVASCVGIGITGWLVPMGNQAFRVAAYRQIVSSPGWAGGAVDIPRGPNETPLFEAAASSDPAVRRSFHVRTALAIGAGVLTFFALGLANVIRRRTAAVVAGIALPVTYFATVWCIAFATEREGLALWVANIALGAGAAMLIRSVQSRNSTALAR